MPMLGKAEDETLEVSLCHEKPRFQAKGTTRDDSTDAC